MVAVIYFHSGNDGRVISRRYKSVQALERSNGCYTWRFRMEANYIEGYRGMAMEVLTEKRKFKRQTNINSQKLPVVSFEIENGLSPNILMKGSVTDISETGMGLSLESPLKIGQQLKFTKKHSRLRHELTGSAGVVMWTFKSCDGFRVGVQFS